jgi:hypothetical protein
MAEETKQHVFAVFTHEHCCPLQELIRGLISQRWPAWPCHNFNSYAFALLLVATIITAAAAQSLFQSSAKCAGLRVTVKVR